MAPSAGRRTLPWLLAPVLLALMVLAWSIVPEGPGAWAATSAIQPGNTPTPIPGATNGQLPTSDLIEVTPSCFAARAAGPSLRLLLLTARGDHQSIGTEECYRAEQTQAADYQGACSSGNCACAGPPGHSMHGWGKAVDFSDRGGSMDFGSPGYAWLKANAGRFGWNHPGWAEPGGSPCPEAWHWEWVGDGGTYGATPIRADVVALLATPGGAGYSTVTGLGLVTARGDALDAGSASGYPLAQLVVGGARTPTGRGYWLVAADGGVFSFGDAGFFGSLGAVRLNQPVVGMAATPTGRGYWLVAADGGVFSFGDAGFFGSLGAVRLNQPVVGMAATPTGRGYWLVAADGGVFSFGDAGFFGSLGAVRLNQPVVGLAATPTGRGYWLVAADGGVFSFGGARFSGSAAATPLAEPVVGISVQPGGGGYWVVAADGTVVPFGTAGWYGNG